MSVESISSIIIPLSVVTITFAIGLELRVEDFRRVLSQARRVAVGASAELLVPILVSFSLLAWLDASPALVAGLVILVSCPSGIFSNALTYFGGGHLPLSITLTAVSSVIALVGLPLVSSLGFWLFLRQDQRVTLPIFQTYLSLFFMVLLPMTLGMIVLARRQRWAKRHRGKLRTFSQVVIIAVVIMNFLGERGQLAGANFSEAARLALPFLAGNALLGYLIPALFRLDRDSCYAIAMEVSNKNISLVFLIALTMLERPEYATFGAVYWIAVKISLLPVALVRGYRSRRREAG